MVASSKGSMWIKRKCFHLSTTIDGPLQWENCLGIECKGRSVEWSFYKQNTSLAPDACVFGPSPLSYFWLGEHLSVGRSTCLHCPTRHHGVWTPTRNPIVWWRRLVKVWLALLLVYSMLHLDYGRFRMNGGKQSLNQFSREARRTGEIHRATGQFPWHPVLRVQWRSCLTPGSSNKFASLSTSIRFPTEPLNRHAALLSGPPMAHGFGRGSQCSQSVFLDLSKAYDRISINALLRKLSLSLSLSLSDWF